MDFRKAKLKSSPNNNNNNNNALVLIYLCASFSPKDKLKTTVGKQEKHTQLKYEHRATFII
jgi:hypothetical protein